MASRKNQLTPAQKRARTLARKKREAQAKARALSERSRKGWATRKRNERKRQKEQAALAQVKKPSRKRSGKKKSRSSYLDDLKKEQLKRRRRLLAQLKEFETRENAEFADGGMIEARGMVNPMFLTANGVISTQASRLRLLPSKKKVNLLQKLHNSKNLESDAIAVAKRYQISLREVYTFFFSS